MGHTATRLRFMALVVVAVTTLTPRYAASGPAAVAAGAAAVAVIAIRSRRLGADPN